MPGITYETGVPFQEILNRAKTENWTTLALTSDRNKNWWRGFLLEDNYTGPSFHLEELTSAQIKQLTTKSNWTHLVLDSLGINAAGAKALGGLSSLTSLNLYNNKIGAEGAKALGGLSGLTSLNLSSNSIGDEGAKALAGLSGLTSLNLSYNSVGDEGAKSLGGLSGLTSLDLRNNGIGAEGAKALGGLGGLTSLNLYNNSIGAEGAKALAGLSGLTSLNLGLNSIGAEGAKALAGLSGLTSLNLNGNSIGAEGAKALAGLSGLTSLNLGYNKIGAEGAKALAGLSELTSLNLVNNKIGAEGAKAILEAWANRTSGPEPKTLELRGNGDLSTILPPEALETADAQAILAAYRRFYTSPKQSLNEAKLLVVGNEAVGKTSLIRFLTKNKPRDPDEKKTPTVAIQEKIDTTKWCPEKEGITLNIWDFGGQEIMHGTHRYFLTRRSIYLLVLEARREDDRSIYDWLKTIRNRGGDSPIIVVINKCDEGKDGLQLDEATIQRDYPEVVAFARTACNDDDWSRGQINELRALLGQTLNEDPRLKHIRDKIPLAWLRVKNEVAQRAKDARVLPFTDYHEICLAPGGPEDQRISDDAEQRALLGTLHELGTVVAHGLDPESPTELHAISLLDPNWLTNAIYTILNHRQVWEDGGEFNRKDLSKFLSHQTYPKKWHSFILSMMQDEEVGLAFAIPGTNDERYLVPEALPKKGPDFGQFWPKDLLRFRYHYDFLPPGLIPRFIVQSHRFLTENPTRWRYGVVLGAAECTIRVTANRESRSIDLEVAGERGARRLALNEILKDLETVHQLNPEIHPEARVPLPDQPQYSVTYDHLLLLQKRHGDEHEFLPEGATHDYKLGPLLNPVRRENRSHPQAIRDAAREPATRRAKPKSNKAHLFYCYAHEDAKFRDELDKHLAGLKRNQLIGDWYDRKISPGEDWAGKIDEELARADIVLLLVSADFMASDYCNNTELPRALERERKGEVIVIPIILRACLWDDQPYARLEALPEKGKAVKTWADQDEAWLDVAKGIRKLLNGRTDAASS